MSHAEFSNLKRFPAIDGLRAIAASIVVVFHFGGLSWKWISGWTGVQIFFVLSGFLITTLMLREEARYGAISIRAFYLRRVFRILPAYAVVLAVIYILAHLRGQDASIRDTAPYYLSFLNEFKPSPLFLYSWSIGIEQKFYLVWPLLISAGLVGTFTRRVWLSITLIVGLVPLVLVVTAWPYWPVQYASILVGCLLAVIMHNPRSYKIIQPLTHPVTATVIVAGFVGVQLTLFWTSAWFNAVMPRLYIFAFAIAVAVLLPALLGNGPTGKLLASRPFAFVGDRSYSLYLVQGVAGTTVLSVAPVLKASPGVRMVAVFVVALLAADLIYRWAEKPMIDIGRRLTARPPASGALAHPGMQALKVPAQRSPGGHEEQPKADAATVAS
jgi:peptidoglycan/LPS O-acetylase OafA/YrhL